MFFYSAYSSTTGQSWKSDNPYGWLMGAGAYMEYRAKRIRIISVFSLEHEREGA